MMEELGGRQEPDRPAASVGHERDADGVQHAHVVHGKDGRALPWDVVDPGDPKVQGAEVGRAEDSSEHPPPKVELWHARDSTGDVAGGSDGRT